jgi:hypothetical protein
MGGNRPQVCPSVCFRTAPDQKIETHQRLI